MNVPDFYRSYIGTIFRVGGAPGIALRLVEVAVVGPAHGPFRQFSLIFHGPGDRRLPEGTHSLSHDAMPSRDLFLVPIVGSCAERTVYEACCSVPVGVPPSG